MNRRNLSFQSRELIKLNKYYMFSKPMREEDYGYEYPIKANRFGFEFNVRKMRKDEMPDDGITYYCSVDGNIYKDGEDNFNIIS